MKFPLVTRHTQREYTQRWRDTILAGIREIFCGAFECRSLGLSRYRSNRAILHTIITYIFLFRISSITFSSIYRFKLCLNVYFLLFIVIILPTSLLALIKSDHLIKYTRLISFKPSFAFLLFKILSCINKRILR